MHISAFTSHYLLYLVFFHGRLGFSAVLMFSFVNISQVIG